MQTRYLIAILALFYFGYIISQSDTLNRTNDFNCKYGYWKIYTDQTEKPQLFEEGYYVNGRKVGQWNEYNKDGSIKNQIKFVDGRPNGFSAIYNNTGDTIEYGYFTNNRWFGKYVSFFPGNRRQHVFFFNMLGKRDGCQTYYNENGEVVREVDYINGKETTGREFYDNGTIKEHITGNTIRKYDQDGNIKSVIIYNKEGDNKNYTETSFYKNGNISDKITYTNNQRNGIVTTYYDNGNLRLKGAYKNGKMDGKRIYYNKDGKKINEEFVLYSNSNTIERKGKCKHGKPEGALEVYDSKGNLVMQINFKNGAPDGNAYYYSNNKLTSMETYSKGTFVSEFYYKKFSSNN